MKFRSMLCVCALAVSAAMATDVEGLTSDTYGWIKVNSSATNTIIAVPWLNVGGGNVEVAKLVKTDTLTTGDWLYWYNGSNYYAWQLTETACVKAWTPTGTVTEGMTFTAPDATFGLAKGQALFIQRSDTTKDIYLYGQYASGDVAVAVAGGGETPAYTLIANPRTAEVDLNSSAAVTMTGTPNAEDKILVPGTDGAISKEYTYANGAWGYNTKTTIRVGNKDINKLTRTTTNVTLPVGRGVWYVSKGGSPTFTFK